MLRCHYVQSAGWTRNPPARDRALRGPSYRLAARQGVDLFPQMAYVESVVALRAV